MRSKGKINKQLIAVLIFTCLLLMSFIGTKITAGAATEPSSSKDNPYYIRVDVTDIHQELAVVGSSCNNSEGYVVIPTVKQDGTPGEVWWAKVGKGNWSKDSQTVSYYYHCEDCTTKDNSINNNKPINGFPTELLLVKEASASSESYITSDNTFYMSYLKFEVFVSGDGKNYTSVGTFKETKNIYAKFSDEKKIDLNFYAPYPKDIYNINGEEIIDIPKTGSSSHSYKCNVYDQYNARWQKDNDNVVYSVTKQDGVSISDTGELIVDAKAASMENDNPRSEIDITITAKVTSNNQVYRTIDKKVTLRYPKVEIYYMDDEGKQLYGPFEIPLYTDLSEWEHKVDIPEKAADDNYSYEFAGWTCSSKYSYAYDTVIFTASYNKIANKKVEENNQQVLADQKVSAPVGTPFYVDSCKYIVTGEFEVEFSAPKKQNIKKLKIPATVTYDNQEYTVVAIADNALKNCAKLKSVTIPATVKEIGRSSFKKCESLTKITIPSGVVKIDSKAFSGCSELKTITVKSTQIKSVAKNAFSGISEDAKFKYPKSKKKLYLKLFENKKTSKKTKK